MSQPDGPWSRIPPKPRPPPQRPRLNMGLWLLIIAVICAAAFGLSQLFPGRVTGQDWGWVVQAVLLAAFVATGLLTRGLRVRQVVRDLAIWAVIILLAVLAYSFRNEIGAALHLR